MATIVAAVFVMMLIVAMMAVGVIFGRKPISGSCGGVGQALAEPDYVCDLCGNDPNKCIEEKQKSSSPVASSQFYNADR
ncbi:MAG: (Na+)-NQR maturation NqrM [Spongiibacter sp.]|uniref:(Na+)-NQR maturation NqrM n=1 Tax=Spongiibacter thalassae TaxID=2721624 RepID=A0ABX1GFF5_9GAMM|nr:(Na+)-NQR maturation NqrM [Spongiibacter thalassae]NKI17227.1 (Na+)-NQR maturation NqrM [Spongiibacter thalassae]